MKSIVKPLGLALVAASMFAVNQAGATSMIRMGLEDLVRDNSVAVMGEVTEAQSYWNKEHSFILTDVTLQVTEALKGIDEKAGGSINFTVMGGTVGELTNLIVAGPELALGGNYVLFLNKENLPGAQQVLTTRDLSQAVFNVLPSKDDGRLVAVSQAGGYELYPDQRGLSQAVGGEQGMELEQLLNTVRSLENARVTAKEAK